MFGDEFFASLDSDPWTAAHAFSKRFDQFQRDVQHRNDSVEDPLYQHFLDAFGIGQGLAEITEANLVIPELNEDKRANTNKIREYLKTLKAFIDKHHGEHSVQAAKSRLRNRFNLTFVYEFSAGDANKAQALINEIRELIAKSTSFEASHKKRLLARLEKLQSELHKKISDLDAFWGLIGDAGIALGKLGADVQPLFDRIKELTAIVWATQSRAEGLPSNFPPPFQLPSPPATENKPSTPIDI